VSTLSPRRLTAMGYRHHRGRYAEPTSLRMKIRSAGSNARSGVLSDRVAERHRRTRGTGDGVIVPA
jgi:hypothetical protein